jgi:tRNA pseudouridine55 synthase
LDGIANLNKPAGITSFKAVARIRAAAGGIKTGHAGTLDPFAEGVLPVLLGQATRLAEYFLLLPKTYRAQVLLGTATDTCDVTGKITGNGSWDHVSLNYINQSLAAFRGEIFQKPPLFSAIKMGGRRLYQIARQGLQAEPPARQVTVYDIQVLYYSPPVITLEIKCGKGTYIRALARDLGEALGSCACLQGLTRTDYGPFSLDASLDLDKIEQQDGLAYLQRAICPADAILDYLPSVTLETEAAQRICNGNSVKIEASLGRKDILRAYNSGGKLIALLVADEIEGYYRPRKVFCKAGQS